MALPNLSGSYIQETYQRVLQTDGVSITDGTGSVLTTEISTSANIYSSNKEEVFLTFQSQNSAAGDVWYGPNAQGPSYHYWNKTYNSHPNIGLTGQNSGFRLAHKCELINLRWTIIPWDTFSTNETGSFTGSVVIKSGGQSYPILSAAEANTGLYESARCGIEMDVRYANYEARTALSGSWEADTIIYPRYNLSLEGKDWRGSFELQYRRIK